MAFIDIPFEQTTAATDAVLAVMALAAAIYLKRIGKQNRWKTGLWVWVFYLLSLAAILGAVTHGFMMSDELRAFLWHPLNLSLGLLVALFVAGSAYDITSEVTARRILFIMLGLGAGFFSLTLVWPDSFIVFIIYEAAALVFALAGYVWLWGKKHMAGSGQMATGILITIVAAGVQAHNSIVVDFIWQFDHNGVYHLIQMVGVIFLVSGLRSGLRPRE